MKNEREKKNMYKRFKLDAKTSKPGELMKAAMKYKKEGKAFPKMKKHKKAVSEADMGSMKGYNPNLTSPKSSKITPNNIFGVQPTGTVKGSNMAKSKKMKHLKKKGEPMVRMNKPGVPSLKEVKDGGENSKGLGKQAEMYTKSKKMKTMCKTCEKKHEKGKHMKSEPRMEKGKKMKSHKKNWIANAIKKPGALHRELGVKEGHKIPASKLRAAAKKGGKEGKRARLAETLKGFHKM